MFQATGRLAQRDVTVIRVEEVSRDPRTGGFAVPSRYAVVPKAPGARGTPIRGYLIPATFRVEGLGFPLTYDVGWLPHPTKIAYGVTYLSAGSRDESEPLRTSTGLIRGSSNLTFPVVDLDDLSHAALVRLALRASYVTGFAYQPGTTYNTRTGAVTGRLKPGDPIPAPPVGYVGVLERHDEPGTVWRLGKSPTAVLMFRHDDGKPVSESDVRGMTGKERAGRHAVSDEVLRMVGRFYDEAYDRDVDDKPHYVRIKLQDATDGRLDYLENTIRGLGVEAGKRGYRTKGLRKPRKKGRTK